MWSIKLNWTKVRISLFILIIFSNSKAFQKFKRIIKAIT